MKFIVPFVSCCLFATQVLATTITSQAKYNGAVGVRHAALERRCPQLTHCHGCPEEVKELDVKELEIKEIEIKKAAIFHPTPAELIAGHEKLIHVGEKKIAPKTELVSATVKKEILGYATQEYREYIAGVVFLGTARFTDAFATSVGSCGFPVGSFSETYLIGLPRRLMYFSMWAGILNPNHNPLCGTKCLIRNRDTGNTIVALVIDTADTDEPNPILSREAFLALGGTVTAGVLNVAFEYDRFVY